MAMSDGSGGAPPAPPSATSEILAHIGDATVAVGGTLWTVAGVLGEIAQEGPSYLLGFMPAPGPAAPLSPPAEVPVARRPAAPAGKLPWLG